MNLWGIVVIVGVRAHGDQGLIDKGGIQIGLDTLGAIAGPVVVFHHNDEDVLNVVGCGGRIDGGATAA